MEIEAALRNQSGVKEAVVVARDTEIGDTRLVAYVVPVNGGRISVKNLRKALNEIYRSI